MLCSDFNLRELFFSESVADALPLGFFFALVSLLETLLPPDFLEAVLPIDFKDALPLDFLLEGDLLADFRGDFSEPVLPLDFFADFCEDVLPVDFRGDFIEEALPLDFRGDLILPPDFLLEGETLPDFFDDLLADGLLSEVFLGGE